MVQQNLKSNTVGSNLHKQILHKYTKAMKLITVSYNSKSGTEVSSKLNHRNSLLWNLGPMSESSSEG